MKRSSPYYALSYRVDCMRPPSPAQWFEPIAAFNCGQAAHHYADFCRKAHDATWTYRVMKREGRGQWVEVKP